MKALEMNEVVGRRIVDVVISKPDKPVSMAGSSESKCYLQLDSGLVLQLDGRVLKPFENAELPSITRDRETEAEFVEIVGEKIVDVVHDGMVVYVVVKGGLSMSTGLGQFWTRPYLDRSPSYYEEPKSIW